MKKISDNKTEEWVNISFEGRKLRVKKGQSLAAALLSHGVYILGRSFKFHRPRGYYCGKGYCNNCALTVDGLPNVLSCEHKVVGGEKINRERGWPSASFDVLSVLGLFGRWLRPGFQKDLFPKHPRLAKFAISIIRKMAGGNRLPTESAAQGQILTNVSKNVDVLIVGGGMSGCLAALGAANAGANVVLVERDALGGRSLFEPVLTGLDSNNPADIKIDSLIKDVRNNAKIEVIQGTAMGYFEDGIVPVLTPTHMFECSAKKLIVATGAHDQPAQFAGNDKPNVVLADGVLELIIKQNLVPWRKAVVLTDSSRGYHVSDLLQKNGVEVIAVVDNSDIATRDENHKNLAKSAGSAINGCITSVEGMNKVKHVNIKSANGNIKHKVDLVCVALASQPANALWHQWCRSHPESVATELNGAVMQYSSISETALTKVGSAAGWQISKTKSTAFTVGEQVALATTSKQL